MSDAARAALAMEPALIDSILCGGDDYELLFTLPADRVEQVRAAAIRCGLTASPIGRMVSGAEVSVRRGEGRAEPFTGDASWRHY